MTTVGRRKADLRITLVSGTTLDLTLARDESGLAELRRTTSQDTLNPIINTSGELDYAAQSPRHGVTRSLETFGGGLGPETLSPGQYYYVVNGDARGGFVLPGPSQRVDLTGIALNEKVVRPALRVGNDRWLITSTTVYRSVAGTGNWTEVGANGAGWTVGNPTDIIAFGLSGSNPIIAVAMGSSTVWQYTVDNGANWIASTRAGNGKYANYFALDADPTFPKVWYAVNPNILYSTDSLLNAGGVMTETFIGDYVNDAWHSLTVRNGVLYGGKRRSLYDGVGNVVAGPYRYYSASNAGTFTGYPDRPANANFANPVKLDGWLYYIVEDKRIIGLDPDGGVVEGIEPRAWGAAPRLDTTVLSLVVVGGELWCALGESVSSPSPNWTTRRTTLLLGSDDLLGHDVTTEDADIYAGRKNPDGSWTWHGSLLRLEETNQKICRLLWYDDELHLLYIADAAQRAANFSQYRAYVAPGNPLVVEEMESGNALGVELSKKVWQLETGADYSGRPSVVKALAFGQGTISLGAPSSTASLKVEYAQWLGTTGSAVAYATLATYTTTALATAGTQFPDSSIYRAVWYRFTSAGTPAENMYAILYNFAFTYHAYDPRYADLMFAVGRGRGKKAVSGAMHPMSFAQVNALADAWEAEQEPADIEDLATGETWHVNLDRIDRIGAGQERRFEFYCHEVR